MGQEPQSRRFATHKFWMKLCNMACEISLTVSNRLGEINPVVAYLFRALLELINV